MAEARGVDQFPSGEVDHFPSGACRRVFVFGMRHGFKLLAAFVVLGYGLSLIGPGPAGAVPPDERDAKVEAQKKLALSDAPLNKKRGFRIPCG